LFFHIFFTEAISSPGIGRPDARNSAKWAGLSGKGRRLPARSGNLHNSFDFFESLNLRNSAGARLRRVCAPTVLLAATHPDTGPSLRLEGLRRRQSAFSLQLSQWRLLIAQIAADVFS